MTELPAGIAPSESDTSGVTRIVASIRLRSGTVDGSAVSGLLALLCPSVMHASCERPLGMLAEVLDEPTREHHRHAHDRQLRVHADARRQDAPVDHEEVLDVPRLARGLHHAGLALRAH